MRVLIRDAERAEELAGRGAEVAIGDLGDAESLAAAHDGVESVVVHLPLQYDFELHEAYGRNAIDAAAAAGVSMLVFNTSAHVLQGTDVTVYQVRQRMVDLLRGSGVPNVVLRPTFYLDNLLGPWIKPGIVEQGVLAFPLPPEFRMSWVASQEVGAYARLPSLTGISPAVSSTSADRRGSPARSSRHASPAPSDDRCGTSASRPTPTSKLSCRCSVTRSPSRLRSRSARSCRSGTGPST